MFFLQNGFNLLFTGFGSKKSLIEEFCMAKLNYGGLIVVNGFFKGMNVSSILTGISEKILKGNVFYNTISNTRFSALGGSLFF